MAEYSVHDRKRDRALAGLDVKTLRGIEIGPLDRPLVTRDMSEVYYVDHASNADLQKKYWGDPLVNSENIPTIDYVWTDSPLCELIGSKAPLDYIIASHVIEHVPNFIGWLREAFSALKVGGILILVVPDKRFTFDVHRRTSAFEEVKQAYIEQRRRPGLRCIMDHFANVVSANTWKLWDDYSIKQDFQFCHGPEYLTLAQEHYAQGLYLDVHCWVFTPWSFFSLLGRIAGLVGFEFDLRHFQTTQRHDLEFYVQLTRTAASSTDWNCMAEDAYRNAQRPKTSLITRRHLKEEI